MKIAVIGRSEILFNFMKEAINHGHEIKLIITAKEAPEYTKTSKDFQTFANEIGAGFIHSAKIQEEISSIKKFDNIDIAISVNYSGIISQQVIDCFKMGILNAHGGDLPRYRGNACQAWAIINKEDRVGLCIHKMIGGELDSGDIIARDFLKINIETKVGDIWKWMKKEIPLLFLNAIENLEKNPKFIIEEQDKNIKNALRCYPRMPEDGKINWKDSSETIVRLVNASNKPYSGAFCNYGEDKLIIWDASIQHDNEVFNAIPGQITLISEGYIEVASGDGKIKIKLIEYKSEVITPDQIIKSIRKRLT